MNGFENRLSSISTRIIGRMADYLHNTSDQNMLILA